MKTFKYVVPFVVLLLVNESLGLGALRDLARGLFNIREKGNRGETYGINLGGNLTGPGGTGLRVYGIATSAAALGSGPVRASIRNNGDADTAADPIANIGVDNAVRNNDESVDLSVTPFKGGNGNSGQGAVKWPIYQHAYGQGYEQGYGPGNGQDLGNTGYYRNGPSQREQEYVPNHGNEGAGYYRDFGQGNAGGRGGSYGQGNDGPYGPGSGRSYGQGNDRPYGPGSGGSYGQGNDGPYGPGSGGSYGQGNDGPYGPGSGGSYGQGNDGPYGPGSGGSYGQGNDGPYGPGSGGSYGQRNDGPYGQGGGRPYGQGTDGYYGQGNGGSYNQGYDGSYGLANQGSLGQRPRSQGSYDQENVRYPQSATNVNAQRNGGFYRPRSVGSFSGTHDGSYGPGNQGSSGQGMIQ